MTARARRRPVASKPPDGGSVAPEPRLVAATLDAGGRRVTFGLEDGRIQSVDLARLGIPTKPTLVFATPDDHGSGLRLLREDGTIEDCSLDLLMSGPRPASVLEASTKGLAKRVASRLRRLRASRGWSQREIARRLGMAPPNYARLESGSHVASVETLVRLASCLEVPLSELVAR